MTRYVAQMDEARLAFEKKYGKGLIELKMCDEIADARQLSDRDVVYLHYYVFSNAMIAMRDDARRASRRGAIFGAIFTDTLEQNWRVKPAQSLSGADAYLRMGGVENLTSFLALLYKAGGGKLISEIPPPHSQLMQGIYHPRADHVFTSLSEYLAWYKGYNPKALARPMVGIAFYSNNYNFQDLAHIDALVKAVEGRGLAVAPIFGWPFPTMGKVLEVDGKSPFGVMLALNLTMPNDASSAIFAKSGVHVIDLMVSPTSYAEWSASMRGLPANRINMNLVTPERIGATEPLLVATSEKDSAGSTHTMPVADRIESAASRAQRWIMLQTKSNADKRVAMVYYNNPPGRGDIGASYLDVPNSLHDVMERMRTEGYRLGRTLPDEKQLLRMLELSGRNVEEFAPGELEDLVKQGHAILWPVTRYRHWFNLLPKQFRDSVIDRWGKPEQSKFMTVTDSKGRRCFVIPGVVLGNVFLGPQPLRTTYAEAAQSAHDTVTPVPHQYVAAYLWYQHEFNADAIVHVGRHGTLEWLPGKDVGQAAWDHSEALLGDLPDIYYYIIDGGGEAIQARRRGAAVLVGHLTPMIAAAGVTKDLERLHDLVEKAEGNEESSPELSEQYRLDAEREIDRLHICSQLGMDCGHMQLEEKIRRVDSFLHGLEESPIPLGLHRIGSLPSKDVQLAGLQEFLRSGFSDHEQTAVGVSMPAWAQEIYEGREPSVDAAWSDSLKQNAQKQWAAAAEWRRNLLRSPSMELDNFISTLNGHYLEDGILGDPLRTPASLPSGRNLHGFDVRMIPTRQAWALGKRMAAQLVERFRKEQGHVPQKVSLVLWCGESIRHEGAMEAEALYLMGVEPVWSPRGVPDQLRLIPLEELGRPRVDVILTISGIYRDGMGEKVILLDQAARLAADAPGPNVLREHNKSVTEALVKRGMDAKVAEEMARARIYGSKPGAYGVGVSRMVEQSRDAGNREGVAAEYLRNMNFLYTQQRWGEGVSGALAEQLKGNEAVIHSRSTNVYGLTDNDDVYQFLGGLGLTSSVVNGKAPEVLINNMRKSGEESVQGLQGFLATELNGRLWNPRWIREMQKAGYAGARQFSKETENLYGFQATTPEQMSGQFWQNTYETYVADKNGMGMQEFFEKENPHAQQKLLARLLEVDRQGSYHFDEKARQQMIEKYVRSVNKYGMDCSANTCGNQRLMQFVAAQASLTPGLGNLDITQLASRMAHSMHVTARDFPQASGAFRRGVTAGQSVATHASENAPSRTTSSTRSNSTTPSQLYVKGYVVQQETQMSLRGISGGNSTAAPWGLMAAILAMLCGVLWEYRAIH